MKRFFVLSLVLVSVLTMVTAQQSDDMSKYLKKDAVQMVDGRVTFTDSVSIIAGYTPKQVNSVARAWMDKFLDVEKNTGNKVLSDNGNEIVASAQMEIVFQKNAFAYDKALMSYVLTVKSSGENCIIRVDRIRYSYNDGTGYETIVAEDYITYEKAVNRKGTKLYPITGKFRRKTIDAAEEIINSFKEGMKYYSREGIAQVVKDAPHVMVADKSRNLQEQHQQEEKQVEPENITLQAVVAEIVEQSFFDGYRKISPEEIQGNFIKMVGKDWMLITAGDSAKFNMMTASWGGIGVLYNKPVAICFINPARYTFGIMEKGDTYTLTFYPDNCRKALEYCGTKSGRNEDKVKGSGLTPIQTENGAIAFKEAKMIIECRKLVSQSISLDAIDNSQEREKRAMQPMHKMYIGEILNVWVK